MKLSKILQKFNKLTIAIEGEGVEIQEVLAPLGILYICLCKKNNIDADTALSTMEDFWNQIGDDYESMLIIPEKKVFN